MSQTFCENEDKPTHWGGRYTGRQNKFWTIASVAVTRLRDVAVLHGPKTYRLRVFKHCSLKTSERTHFAICTNYLRDSF